MSELLRWAWEIAASSVVVGGVGIGLVASARALWRWAGHLGYGIDMQRLAIQADLEKEKARAEIASAHARVTEALQPRTIHYAPNTTYSPHMTAPRATSGVQMDGAREDVPVVPTFADLLSDGKVGKGNALLLGYNDGTPIYGDWRDLYSTGIGGISGSGKSWTAAYLLSQSALHGACIALLDPHSGDKESLSSRLAPLSSCFLCDAAGDSRQMIDIVAMVGAELQRRQRTRDNRIPWVLVADEFSSLMRGELADPLARLFEKIAQEGRKLQIYGMALGQVWQASRSGGGELRDSLASCYLHRLRPNQARYLTGLTASSLPSDLLDLPAGTAYLMSTSGELRRVTIPRCTDSDIATVAGVLTDNAPTLEMPARKRAVNEAETREKPGDTPLETQKPQTAQEGRIIALARQATPISQIVSEVWGVRGGSKYQERAGEVMRVISDELQKTTHHC